MKNSIDAIAERYQEIYNSFDGEVHLIDLELESINILAEELFYSSTPYSPRQALVNMYYLGKINKQFENEK